MKVLSSLGLVILLGCGFADAAIASTSTSTTTIFRTEDKVFFTNLKPKSKVEIAMQRITFRKLVADRCGEVSFNSSTIPALVLVGDRVFNPAKFALDATRVCTRDSPKSDRSYKTSNTKFVIAGLKPLQPHLVRIIKPAKKSLKTNRCGYGAIAITQSLTPFAGSYEDNIYGVNGKKLKDLPIQKPPKC